MSTSNVDSGGMRNARNTALGSAGSLQGYGNANQDFATKQRNDQFGANGTLSGFMNPNSMNVTAPTGAFATQYQNQANQINQGANQGVATANRQQADMGGGLQPSGFGSAQRMSAYQNAADAKAGAYGNATMNQMGMAANNFWNAQNAYSGAGGQAAGLAGSEQSNAGQIGSDIYGKASAQKKSVLGSLAGFAAQGAAGVM